MELYELHRGLELADTLEHGSVTHGRVPFPFVPSSAVLRGAVFIIWTEKEVHDQPTIFVSVRLIFSGA